MNVKLVVSQGKPEGKEIPLRIPKFLIGRGTECHLRPNSELVSRHHCMLLIGENDVRLRDLGSTNGTLVNGNRISSDVVVRSGDMIHVGPLVFQLVMEPVPATRPAAATPETTATLTDSAKLPSRSAEDTDVDQWIVSDTKHEVPESGLSVVSGDTELFRKTDEIPQDEDTKTDVVPASEAIPSSDAVDRLATSDDGGKPKSTAASRSHAEAREDTSRAAADILSRKVDDRPVRN